MSLTQQYRTLCLPEQWRGSLLRQVCLGEDGLRLEGGALWGAAALPPGGKGVVLENLLLRVEMAMNAAAGAADVPVPAAPEKEVPDA